MIFTVSNAPYFGPVQFAYFTQNFHAAGSVSPSSRTLAPGQTGTFQVSVTAGQAGDKGLKLHLGTGGNADGSIPIIIRALVPISRGGRDVHRHAHRRRRPRSTSGQEFTYQFNVPPGKPSLNLGVQFATPTTGSKGS